ncbi:hypothetical protein [Roseateles sp. YR242]|uniref:hypothetical protein n=1 Tax=Roseateles sp. YR242 TaxID=1855305 RepID=UPI00116018D9|nr:hypothetical protein [Roseateles sp. YR242]
MPPGDGSVCTLPSVLGNGQALEVASPLLGHTMALEPYSAAGALFHHCFPCFSGEYPSGNSRRIVNATEIWPGMIMSGTPPGNHPDLVRDWLVALGEAKAGLVLDVRSDEERARDGVAGSILDGRLVRAEGTQIRATLSRPESVEWPLGLTEPLQRSTLNAHITDARGATWHHAMHVMRVPQPAELAPTTAFLAWAASLAAKVMTPLTKARSDQQDPQAPPACSVVVQSAQGLDRAAPTLLAMQLRRLLQNSNYPTQNTPALVKELAMDLRARRGPSMVWTAPMLAPLLALAEAWGRHPPAMRQPSRAFPPSAKSNTPPSKTKAPSYAGQLNEVRKHRAMVEGTPRVRPGRLPALMPPAPPGEDADAAPPPPAGLPSQKA